MEIPAIRTENLGRSYRLPRKNNSAPDAPTHMHALADVNLEVRPGELFGLLGPNGAGKSTLIKILTTLLAPTSGRAWVDGLDVVTQTQQLRPRINLVSGGETSGYGVLTVQENLWLFTQIYGVSYADARRRIADMLQIVGLTEKANTKVSHLSTGMRQKMNFCRGFITDPKILFLDEPTLGLDVTVARSIRQYLRSWMKERPERTLLLTTHYMAEADELCDRVAIINGGRVLACDSPANLKRQVQSHPIFALTLTPGPSGNGWHELSHVPGVRQCTAELGPTAVDVKVALEEEPVIGSVVQHVVTQGSRILSLQKVEPTLEDVFIELVGHGLNSGDSK